MEEVIMRLTEDADANLAFLQDNFWKLYQMNLDQMVDPEVYRKDKGIIAVATGIAVTLCVARALSNQQPLGGLPLKEGLEQFQTWRDAADEDIQNNIRNRRN